MSRKHDALIKAALAQPDDLPVPPALAARIGHAIRATPQERSAGGWHQLTRARSAPRSAWPVLVAALLLLAIATLVVGSGWMDRPSMPMFRGGPGRTGVNPGPAPKGVPVVAWSAQLTTGAVLSTAAPVVGGGRVFVVDDSGFVTAFDEHDGVQRWSVELSDPIRSSPVLVGDHLIVGTDGGEVVALDAGTGARIWSFPTDGPVSGSLAFADGTLYVPSEDRTLYALGMDGGERWRSDDLGAPLDRGPAVADGIVYQPTSGGSLVAMRVADGAPIWHKDLGQTGVTTPSVIDGTAYVGLGLLVPDSPRALVALDATSGSTRWTWSPPTGNEVSLAAVDHGTVLVAAKDDGITSLEPTTGGQRWMTPIPANAPVGGALVDGTLVVVADDGSVVALDAGSGSSLWTAHVPGMPGPPVVVDGLVIVATSYGTVVAFGDQVGTIGPSGG